MKKSNPDQLAAVLGNPNARFVMIGKAARGFSGLIATEGSRDFFPAR